jgi:hypothetical protein
VALVVCETCPILAEDLNRYGNGPLEAGPYCIQKRRVPKLAPLLRERTRQRGGAVDDDVSWVAGPNADRPEQVEAYLPADIRSLYDAYSYRHAAAILATSFPDEFAELLAALRELRITTVDIGMPGGNESGIPKKYSAILRPRGWEEARIRGDLSVHMQSAHGVARDLPGFIDGHKIDYVKGRVAFDLEWNSKDQTFDRDLFAMRTFHECGLISVGVLVTRSPSMNPVFDVVPRLDKTGMRVPSGETVKSKYGASTTWMGKLLYRLNASRHGGCPILALGMTPQVISDQAELLSMGFRP